jgi:hypothetical protein
VIPENARLFDLLIALGTAGFGIYLVVMPERALQESKRPTTKLAVAKVRAIGILAIAMGVFVLVAIVPR